MKHSKFFTGALCALLTLGLVSCGAPGAAETETVAPTPQAGQFVFTRDNFPRLDGSTSTAPLARAIASVMLGETEDQVSDLVNFSRTTESFRQLMAGNTDLLIVGEPNASVWDELKQNNFEVTKDTFATDGLVFVVNKDNPVDSLTVDQIRDIYSGKITNWSQVGGDDVAIVPFQRNSEAGSQSLMLKLVMGDTPMMDAPKDYIVDSMQGLIDAVKNYDNSTGALGYTVYYYASEMQKAQGLKLISVNGTEPSNDTIRSGDYPLRNAYYVVKSAKEPAGSATSVLYDWILSDEGQKLVDKMGYVSVTDVSGK